MKTKHIPILSILLIAATILFFTLKRANPINVTITKSHSPIPADLYRKAKNTFAIDYYRNDSSIFEHIGDVSLRESINRFLEAAASDNPRDVFTLSVYNFSEEKLMEQFDLNWRLVDWRISNIKSVNKKVTYFSFLSVEKVGDEYYENTGVMFWQKFGEKWYFLNFPFYLTKFDQVWPAGPKQIPLKQEVAPHFEYLKWD